MSGSRRRSGKRPPARRRRRGDGSRLRRLTAGDRIYLLVLFVVIVLLGVMAIAPLQSYTAAEDRTDRLAASVDRLQEEVDALEERRERLSDPDEIELLAREEHGLVKPGEEPYVVVTPEPEFTRPEPDTGEDPDAVPWYERLRDAALDLFRD